MAKINKTIAFIILLNVIISCTLCLGAAKKNDSGVPTGREIAEYAKSFEGCSYVYGASGPKAFDCSGFVKYVFAHFGKEFPHTAAHYRSVSESDGRIVSEKNAKPGDIVSWKGHVGIYIGNGKVIHALNSRYGVCISKISEFRNRYGVSNPEHHYVRVNFEKPEEEKKAKDAEEKKAAEPKIEISVQPTAGDPLLPEEQSSTSLLSDIIEGEKTGTKLPDAALKLERKAK